MLYWRHFIDVAIWQIIAMHFTSIIYTLACDVYCIQILFCVYFMFSRDILSV